MLGSIAKRSPIMRRPKFRGSVDISASLSDCPQKGQSRILQITPDCSGKEWVCASPDCKSTQITNTMTNPSPKLAPQKKNLTSNQQAALDICKNNPGWINPLDWYTGRSAGHRARRNAFDQLVRKGILEKQGSICLYKVKDDA